MTQVIRYDEQFRYVCDTDSTHHTWRENEQVAIKRAVGGYDRSESIHLPLRGLGLAPDQVQYKHDKRCYVHRQVCGEQSDSEVCSPLLFLMRGTRQMLGLRRIVWYGVRCGIWEEGQ